MWVNRSQALMLPDGRRAVTVNGDCRIGHKRRCPRVDIEAAVCIGDGAEIEAGFIGMGTFIGRGTSILRTESVGRFVTIGEYCSIGAELAETGKRISTSYFVKGRALSWYEKFMVPVQVYRSTAKKKLRIGSDVYIGAHSVVAEGISIGDGAILLPGTAADKDIPSYSVVYGNPAKIWEYRFSREETERLKKIRWWDYGERLLGKADFAGADFDKVLEILEKEKDQITPILPMETGMKIRYKDGYCCIYSKLMDQKTLLYQFPENG